MQFALRNNCYIIAEGFFFILSFLVGYFLSFGLVRLRTIWLIAQVGAHIECRCSRSCGEDVKITDFIIKTPDRNETGDVNDVMPGSDGLRILGDFWKKNRELRFEPRRSELTFLTWARPVQVWTTGFPMYISHIRIWLCYTTMSIVWFI